MVAGVAGTILLAAETALSRPCGLGESLVKGGGAETRYGDTWDGGSAVEAVLWLYGSATELEKGTRGDMALLLSFIRRIADARSESLRRLCI